MKLRYFVQWDLLIYKMVLLKNTVTLTWTWFNKVCNKNGSWFNTSKMTKAADFEIIKKNIDE